MRQQQKEILDALIKSGKDRAFHLDVAAFTFGEMMEMLEHLSEELFRKRERLNKNTAQAWLRDGVVPETTRAKRNRLFTGADLIRFAAVFFLTEAGISRKLAILLSQQVFEHFKEHFGARWKDVRPGLVFDPEDYVYCWRQMRSGKGWGILRGGSPAQFHGALALGLPAVVIPARHLCYLCIDEALRKWEEKNRAMANLLQREIDRLAAKKAKARRKAPK